MLKLKIWLLNLKDIATADESFKALVPISMHGYDYYKLYDNNPEDHMMYSTEYLNTTSVVKLLWKNYQWQSFFKYVQLKVADRNG